MDADTQDRIRSAELSARAADMHARRLSEKTRLLQQLTAGSYPLGSVLKATGEAIDQLTITMHELAKVMSDLTDSAVPGDIAEAARVAAERQ